MGLSFGEFYPEVQAGLSFEVESVLYSGQSRFQKIEVLQTKGFGRMLLLDGMVMLCERDEFIYHEMIAHVPLFTHPHPRAVLVIGGGDGGTVRECLRHPAVQRIDLVEIDEMVTRVCLQYFPALASPLLAERVQIHFRDGVEFVQQTGQRYDAILIDSTDPVSVGEGLFSAEFYQNCRKILNPGGILVTQSESPAWQQQNLRNISRKLRAVFPKVYYYQAHIPTYPSGHWLFGLASEVYHPQRDFHAARCREYNLAFRYYNEEIHAGAFALPGFVKELLGGTNK